MTESPKKGVLLVNLGSPDSPETKDVRKYLSEFLMDKHVIDSPYLIRTFVVKGMILPTRPKHSAKAYKKVWTEEGSPLIVITKKLTEKVAERSSVPVVMAMRYGSPSIKTGLGELYAQGVRDTLVVPLYPQHTMSTTETVMHKVEEVGNKFFKDMEVSFLPAFYHKQDYISILSKIIEKDLKEQESDHLLFSYHGVPERHIHKTDVTQSHCQINGTCCNTPSPAHSFCYRHQCLETTRLVADALNLKEGTYSTSFQSRLGRSEWLKPYTANRIEELAAEGVKRLVVATPAFVADCLETLEEIAMEGKHSFLEAGGEHFHAAPCLNDDDEWAEVMSNWIENWAKE